jgi:hypothetical protein
MKKLLRTLIFAAPIAGIVSYKATVGAPVQAEEETSTVNSDGADAAFNAIFPDRELYDNTVFPRDVHYLLPPPVNEVPVIGALLSDPDRDFESERVAYGKVQEDELLEQPIAYSHKLHAGELQIECQYCHTYARRSMHAGIPSTQICMNCHGKGPDGKPKISVENRDELLKVLTFFYGREEVTKMVGADKAIPLETSTAKGNVPVEQGEIPWVKVHDLPDFVYFAHKGHIRAGVQCEECHGDMKKETVGRRVSELTMGWCLDCHESHPSVEENYCDLPEGQTTCAQAELRRTEIKDCWNCHN